MSKKVRLKQRIRQLNLFSFSLLTVITAGAQSTSSNSVTPPANLITAVPATNAHAAASIPLVMSPTATVTAAPPTASPVPASAPASAPTSTPTPVSVHVPASAPVSASALAAEPVPVAKITVPAAAKPAHVVNPPAELIKKNGKLSFNFQDIGIKNLLQLIAMNSGNNFVISDAVKGNMSLFLQNVTWQKALDVVIRANGLDSRQLDNVIIIAPIEELAASDLKRLQAQQQLENLSPSVSKIIRLRFANAADLATVIKGQQNSLLSQNGQIGTDPRTNTIWVRDNQASIDKVASFISQLDVPAKQVLIEARIVSVDERYAKELGVRWGYSNQRNLSGNLYGANQLRNGVAPSDITNRAGEIDPNQRLNFNMPANPAGVLNAQQAGSIGLALLHLGKGYLDLELSALEGSQHAQVVANPRVVTSNLQKATIQTGEEIPYQEATSSGATNVAFKKAVLSLDIIPQITSDNNVVLNLSVNQDKRGPSVQTSPTSEIPSIDTQQVKSNVLLKDGETIVIGGIYKQDKNETYQRVPFFGALPVIGNLFRYRHEDIDRNELMIFITPKIVDQNSIGNLSNNEKQLNQISLDADKNMDTHSYQQVMKDEKEMH